MDGHAFSLPSSARWYSTDLVRDHEKGAEHKILFQRLECLKRQLVDELISQIFRLLGSHSASPDNRHPATMVRYPTLSKVIFDV